MSLVKLIFMSSYFDFRIFLFVFFGVFPSDRVPGRLNDKTFPGLSLIKVGTNRESHPDTRDSVDKSRGQRRTFIGSVVQFFCRH